MFKKELIQFIDFDPITDKPECIIDTKNQYEFDMQAFRLKGEWYVLVYGADTSRFVEMAQIITDEFDSGIKAWCRPKSAGGGSIPAIRPDQYAELTYWQNDQPVWLLKIDPSDTIRQKYE